MRNFIHIDQKLEQVNIDKIIGGNNGYAIDENKNVIGLTLFQNQITDISDLKGLQNLAKLYSPINQITDISPLKDLQNLTELYLWSNQITEENI